MSANAIILTGAPGCGKTHFTKNTLLRNVNKSALYIFDTNKEYGDFYPYPFKPNVDKFLARVYDIENDTFLMQNTVMLVEDATSFFSNRGRDEVMQRILVGRRHANISVIMLFHSLRDVPKYILTKCNLMFVFKTVDSDKFVRSEFDEHIYNVWKDVQTKASTNPFYKTKPPPKNTVPNWGKIQLY